MKQTHILVVEDSKLSYDRLTEQLLNEKFSVAPYTPNVDKALEQIEKKRPDLVLLDINLEGEKSGIDLGKILYEKYDIPFIYVTELSDSFTFMNALQTHHEQFIRKRMQEGDFIISPDEFEDILRAIYTVLQRKKQTKKQANSPATTIGVEVLTDFLENLKNKGADTVSKLSVKYNEILYFSVDSSIFNKKSLEKNQKNYIYLRTKDKHTYVKKGSLSSIYPELPAFFGKPNQKYIVNILEIEGWVNSLHIKIDDKIIRITETYKQEFMERYNRIFLP